MIESVRITPDFGTDLLFAVPGLDVDGYLVKDITGLGQVPTILSSEVLPGIDGEFFQTSRREKRVITITIKINQNYVGASSVEARRNRLYSLLAFGGVTLQFNGNEYGNVSIYGKVETAEPTFMDEEPAMILTIVCHNPDFVSTSTTSVSFAVLDVLRNINYPGTVPAPIEITMDLPATARTGLTLTMAHLGVSGLTGAFSDPNVFQASPWAWRMRSEPGNRFYGRYLGLFEHPTYSRLDLAGLIWPFLYPGANQLRLKSTVEAGTWNYTLRYRARYGGI